MQQLLQLKPEEPRDAVSTDSLLESSPFSENFGHFSELRDLFGILFKSSFLLEVKEETKSLEINLDEEEKKLILKLKKKIKSKSLAKKGQIYALRKELKMASLTLVYNLQPYYEVSNELQSITPMESMSVVKPLDVFQPKIMIAEIPKLQVKPPILMNNTDNTTIVLPIPKHTENLLQELTKIKYEEKFKPLAIGNVFSEVESELNADNYRLGPEKAIRYEDLVQQYNLNLIFQTPIQIDGQLEGVQVIRYNRPKFENGEFIYQEIRMRATGLTTVYDLIRNSGLHVRAKYSSRFNGVYVESLNGVSESDIFWEYRINGQYGITTVDKAIVRPGDEVTWVLKTARGVCGEPLAG